MLAGIGPVKPVLSTYLIMRSEACGRTGTNRPRAATRSRSEA
jgi:hypothetical protein